MSYFELHLDVLSMFKMHMLYYLVTLLVKIKENRPRDKL